MSKKLSDVERSLRNELKIRYNFLRLLDEKIDENFLKKELANFLKANSMTAGGAFIK